MSLSDRTLAELLDQLAARQPAPGGGSAAAMTAAIAAALVQMATAFASDRDANARAAAVRRRVLELAQDDVGSYEPVLAAMRLDRDSPERAGALKTALSGAANVPLAIATCAAEVAELGAQAATEGSPNLVGDVTAAVLLAESACRAAARLVELNLAATLGDPRLRTATDLARRASIARDAVGRFSPLV